MTQKDEFSEISDLGNDHFCGGSGSSHNFEEDVDTRTEPINGWLVVHVGGLLS